MAFRENVEDLESHRGPGLGKNALDEEAVCVEGAEHVGEGLAGEGSGAVGLDPARWETDARERRLERLAGLGHPDKELDSNQEGCLWDKQERDRLSFAFWK